MPLDLDPTSGFMTPERNEGVKPADAILTEEDKKGPQGDQERNIIPDELVGLASYIKERYDDARNARHYDEMRWLKAYENFKMEWGKSPKVRESEKSRASVNITKLKTLTGYGSVIDVLFGAKQFPITVDPSPKPEGVEEAVHLDVTGGAMGQEEEQPAPVFGYKGDGMEIPPGATEYDLIKLGGAYKDYEGKIPLAKGPGKQGEPTLWPAKAAAKKMEKIMLDQILDNRAARELRKACLEMAMLGTGALKGPLTYEKCIPKWNANGYDPQYKKRPLIKHTSIWNIYPDPYAMEPEELEYIVERHRMTKEQIRNLRKMPGFDNEAILRVVSRQPSYVPEHWEQKLRGEETTGNFFSNRYEVLEFWGILDYDMLERWGYHSRLALDDTKRLNSIQVNVWICGTEVLRCVVNPFVPSRLPYHLFPYERDPYRIFGIGIPERMYDAQMIMNGHLRMGIDNLNLAGNVVLEVDENNLVPGQTMDLHPGKIFYRKTGVPGQAMNSIQIPNVAPAHIQMFDKARMIADEETGIPSVMHGQTGIAGTGRTSSGLSMLMNSAGLATKTVVKNLDDYLLKPLGEALFAWNMQFSREECPEIVGDLEIKPNATTYMMMKEVRSQRLGNMLSLAVNPVLAPFFKLNNLLQEYALANDLNPDEIVNNLEDAQIFAEILKGLANVNAQAPTDGTGSSGSQAPSEPAPGGGGFGGTGTEPNPEDQSGMGAGALGPGTPSPPGTEEYSGVPQ